MFYHQPTVFNFLASARISTEKLFLSYEWVNNSFSKSNWTFAQARKLVEIVCIFSPKSCLSVAKFCKAIPLSTPNCLIHGAHARETQKYER